jgi:hypothetical protein
MTGWLLSLVCLFPAFILVSIDLKRVSPLHTITRLDAPSSTRRKVTFLFLFFFNLRTKAFIMPYLHVLLP